VAGPSDSLQHPESPPFRVTTRVTRRAVDAVAVRIPRSVGVTQALGGRAELLLGRVCEHDGAVADLGHLGQVEVGSRDPGQ
jgi:hypothetical protein